MAILSAFAEVALYLAIPMAIFVAINYWCLFRDRDDG